LRGRPALRAGVVGIVWAGDGGGDADDGAIEIDP
jgi:hypothetical protein